ncbi:MAG: PAC2 family protein [Planctomycetaceae bacterium]|nr:PAC2 family protein [Planctomycetaceae bacterium]
MPDELRLNNPWLVAVWPGMGHVAISAGYYLMAKLGMHLLAELSAQELFDVEHVEVKGGLIHTGRIPRSRFFVWNDPRGKHDIVVFLGEAQPPRGKYAFCLSLIEFARGLGVERVFTFAAMATQMHPKADSRVFGAATDEESLAELKRLELEVLEDGHIGGLNGVVLGVAADHGLRGACLLGEMPHIFTQFPFPKASLAVLEVFTTIADIEIDFTELSEQAKDMEQKLGELLAQVERAYEHGQQAPTEEETVSRSPAEEERLRPEVRRRIEQLFEQAKQDRSYAYELKRELDRLNVYPEYEDRFLDLFKKSE